MKKSILMIAVISLVFICSNAFGEEIMVKSKDGLGDYITDAKGMTLYYFKADSPGKSTCSGGCLEKWPLLYSEEITVSKGSGMDEKEFSSIIRDDGKKQTTLRGYPLYYFAGDKKAGDTNGQGIKDVWLVVDPAKFMK